MSKISSEIFNLDSTMIFSPEKIRGMTILQIA